MSESLYADSLELARTLEPGTHWRMMPRERNVQLTDEGREELARRADGRTGLWVARRAREELAERALSALHLYRRDAQYIVAEGKVQIVDEFTGRVMPDRTWEAGLHQMIEAKEGVEISGRKMTLARITFQRFFRRYHHLTGMTGTAMEVAGEIAGVYRLGVVRVPTNRPSQRRDLGRHLFANADDKWKAIVESARTSVARGQSVLIGTRSVETSEHLSRLLSEADLPHTVLNARQDRNEAEIVAAAGQPNRITVATNMAGRGTDIRLSRPVREAGGLHVILTEFHESKRIDRQLFGRGGRQGDPGGYECFAALDDEILTRFGSSPVRRIAGRLARGETPEVPHRLAGLLVRRAQGEAGRHNARTRREKPYSTTNGWTRFWLSPARGNEHKPSPRDCRAPVDRRYLMAFTNSGTINGNGVFNSDLINNGLIDVFGGVREINGTLSSTLSSGGAISIESSGTLLLDKAASGNNVSFNAATGKLHDFLATRRHHQHVRNRQNQRGVI